MNLNKRIKGAFSLLLVLLVLFSFSGCNTWVITHENTSDVSYKTVTTTEAQSESTSKAETGGNTSDKATSTTVKSTTKLTETESTTKGSTEKGNSKTTVKNKTVSTTEKKTTAKEPTKSHTTEGSRAESCCYITVECKVLLNNMNKLDEGKRGLVPNNGYILNSKKCTLKKNDTVFSVLKRSGVNLGYKNTQFGIYVMGINNLNEKDAGASSGWVYRVNGYFPNYTCENYVVSPGDKIVFSYVI